ncbi:MAG: hypothetical protein K6G25_07905 [Bacteroidales bacterium]|nr:hypothetical protein [Bacteroidales bacterium]
MMMRLMEALFGFDWRQPEQKPSLKTEVPPKAIEKTIVPLQYRDDVEKLKTYVGDENWKPGLLIELELRDLLSICPRERNRSDAYRKLIAYLKDEQKIELKIKTKKR